MEYRYSFLYLPTIARPWYDVIVKEITKVTEPERTGDVTANKFCAEKERLTMRFTLPRDLYHGKMHWKRLRR